MYAGTTPPLVEVDFGAKSPGQTAHSVFFMFVQVAVVCCEGDWVSHVVQDEQVVAVLGMPPL